MSGSFQLASFLDGFLQSYDGVQNVVVRLSRKDGLQDKSAILVNAHFDSVPQVFQIHFIIAFLSTVIVILAGSGCQ